MSASRDAPAAYADDDSDFSSDSEIEEIPTRNDQQLQPHRRQQNRNQPPVEQNAVQGTGQAVAPQPKKKEESNDAIRLRLDVNLEIEVTLKARIHGDLTLALLQ